MPISDGFDELFDIIGYLTNIDGTRQTCVDKGLTSSLWASIPASSVANTGDPSLSGTMAFCRSAEMRMHQHVILSNNRGLRHLSCSTRRDQSFLVQPRTCIFSLFLFPPPQQLSAYSHGVHIVLMGQKASLNSEMRCTCRSRVSLQLASCI